MKVVTRVLKNGNVQLVFELKFSSLSSLEEKRIPCTRTPVPILLHPASRRAHGRGREQQDD